MLDILTQCLKVVLFGAVVIMFFGLVARSNIRAARILGWFSIAWALAVSIVEGYAWYDKGDWIVTQTKQLWHQIDRNSLNDVESMFERYLPDPMAAGADWVLSWPAWLVLGLLGVLFLIYDHIQLQRMYNGAPPPPLWKRLFIWLRDAAKPTEEQA
jgi:hypothetical protein